MTPGARIAAVIELLAQIESGRRQAADAIANDYFRSRRFIGGGDRRAISDMLWAGLRQRYQFGWRLNQVDVTVTPTTLIAAQLIASGWSATDLAREFSGERFAPARLDPSIIAALGRRAPIAEMPDHVRLETPGWLMPMFRARFSANVDAELGALSRPAPLDLRVNSLKGTRDQAIGSLGRDGIGAMPMPYSVCGLRVASRVSVLQTKAFQSGLIEIQDEGSQLVAGLVAARPGMRVVDWCAGAGGKTLAIAAAMGNRGTIIACDISRSKLDAAAKRLRRAGVGNVECHLTVEGDKWRKRRTGQFDRVLVDAPCTGTGTWRRNPDARLRLRPADLEELLVKQAMILRQAASLVRPGGRLIYATCSLLHAENESQIDLFLQSSAEFRLMPHTDPLHPAQTTPYMILSPFQHQTDGFFAAVLERVTSTESNDA